MGFQDFWQAAPGPAVIDYAPPVVEAGAELTPAVPGVSNIGTDASATADAVNGLTIASTLWTVVSKPAASTCTFGSASTIDTTATTDTAGVYRLRLTATDSIGQTGFDEVLLRVTVPPSIAAPIPTATPAVTSQATLAPIVVTGGATLDGGQAVTSWTWTATEEQHDGTSTDVSATALSSTTAQSPTLNPRGQRRTYFLALTVAQTDAQTGATSAAVYISAVERPTITAPSPSYFAVVT